MIFSFSQTYFLILCLTRWPTGKLRVFRVIMIIEIGLIRITGFITTRAIRNTSRVIRILRVTRFIMTRVIGLYMLLSLLRLELLGLLDVLQY
jgi:hypothetical protein